MTGFIKVTAIDNGGISVEAKLQNVGILEKAAILAGVFQGLEIDTRNNNDVATVCALAALLAQNGTRVDVDSGMMAALKKIAEEKREADEDDG